MEDDGVSEPNDFVHRARTRAAELAGEYAAFIRDWPEGPDTTAAVDHAATLVRSLTSNCMDMAATKALEMSPDLTDQETRLEHLRWLAYDSLPDELMLYGRRRPRDEIRPSDERLALARERAPRSR